MPVRRLKEFLDRERVKYVVLSHSPAYTAQEIAAATHIPGKEVVKAVMVKIDGRLAMAVLPASYRVDLDRLRAETRARSVELASEAEFKERFPECDIGAMPPFGNLYEMEVYAAPVLREDREIAFNAGSFTEMVRLSYPDFERLVKPKIVDFAVKSI
jgi:Ala-tRNA(Pro) deacylase